LTRLRVQNLAFALAYKVLLEPLSFGVAAGESIALTGPVGSGKSLLLRLLNRLAEPTGGHVYLNDLDYRTLPATQLRRRILLVAAQPQLLGMTVQDALLYPLRLQCLSASAVEQRILTLLNHWPIPETWLTQTADQLTPQACQIVAIGRGLIASPQVLLLDEPQRLLGSELLAQLREIAKQQEMSLITTGREITADRYLYLEGNRLQWDRTTINWPELIATMETSERAANAEWT
jgi:D-methionine transport system ATP-binding protein